MLGWEFQGKDLLAVWDPVFFNSYSAKSPLQHQQVLDWEFQGKDLPKTWAKRVAGDIGFYMDLGFEGSTGFRKVLPGTGWCQMGTDVLAVHTECVGGRTTRLGKSGGWALQCKGGGSAFWAHWGRR